MNTEKYQTIEEKILAIYSGKAEKLAQRVLFSGKPHIRNIYIISYIILYIILYIIY